MELLQYQMAQSAGDTQPPGTFFGMMNDAKKVLQIFFFPVILKTNKSV